MSENLLSIPDKPHMPDACISYFAEELAQSSSYLEYGSGGSTMLALKQNTPFICSIESDKNWIKSLEIAKSNLHKSYTGQHLIQWVDIGETGPWGYPVDTSMHANYWTYSATPWLKNGSEHRSPDLVLIDGRFRIACMIQTLLHCNAGTTILFDDYMDRPYYHSVEEFLPPKKAIDRMAVFKIESKFEISNEIVRALLASCQDTR